MTDSKFSVTLSNIDLLGSQSTGANATLLNILQKYHLHIKNSGEILNNVLSRLGDIERWRTQQSNNIAALEKILPEVQYKDGTGQQQQEDFTEHTINRLGSLETWRSEISSSYRELTERHERLNEYVKGQDDPSSTFGDNVLMSLQALKDSGAICEMFAGDMAETARDVIGDTDFDDHVETALNNMDLAEHIAVHNLDQYDLWDHIRGYVEDYVSENTVEPDDYKKAERLVEVITERLKLVGIALDPKDRELHGDTRTDKDKFHDGMRSYADFLNGENRHLLAQFANDLLDAQNKEEEKPDGTEAA